MLLAWRSGRGGDVTARPLLAVGCAALALTASLSGQTANAQGGPIALAVTRATADDMRVWDDQVDRMIRRRDLLIRDVQADALVPDRQHQRLDQYFQGV